MVSVSDIYYCAACGNRFIRVFLKSIRYSYTVHEQCNHIDEVLVEDKIKQKGAS